MLNTTYMPNNFTFSFPLNTNYFAFTVWSFIINYIKTQQTCKKQFQFTTTTNLKHLAPKLNAHSDVQNTRI
jgi:hypothetical protein